MINGVEKNTWRHFEKTGLVESYILYKIFKEGE